MIRKKRNIYKHFKWRLSRIRNITIPQWYLSLFLPKYVASGPFRGMLYMSQSTGSVILPKLVGTYEDELHPVLYALKPGDYDLFIDVGAAEGYYAVGIPKFILKDTCTTVAFEAVQKGRKQIKKLAALNKLENILVKGYCDAGQLMDLVRGKRGLILMDVEGGEYDLLKGESSNFTKSDILLEIHSVDDPDAKALLINRFSKSHSIHEYFKKPKSLPSDIRFDTRIVRNGDYVVNEFRSKAESWLFMKSKLFEKG